MPERIQLRRTKGWRMPPNTVKVDRSTAWGNPWPVGERGPLDRIARDAEGAVGFFRAMFTDAQMGRAARYPDANMVREMLRGKNLACWCPKGSPCHADVLLEIANRPTVQHRESHD